MTKTVYISDDSDTEEKTVTVWTICDSHNYFIGARTQNEDEAAEKCVTTLLYESMSQPLSWTPRRPKYVSFPAAQG